MDIRRQAYRYNKNIPPLLEHAHVRRIEGNRLVLGVQDEFFRQKIADPKRARVIEQAIHDLHQVKLRIDVQVVDGVAAPSESPAAAAASSADDPLVAAGRELGGVVDD